MYAKCGEPDNCQKLFGQMGHFFFFFLRERERESFNLWQVALYYQIKILISFWCRRELNSRSLIQLLETLSVELTGTHR